jgi:aspartokinase-like uncharacterized kinase
MTSGVDVVVKIGGGVLAWPEHFAAVLTSVADRARTQHVLVVPGGGPFADTIRDVDRRFALTDEAAHWMAVLAMDQYAHLIATRLSAAALVENRDQILAALNAGRLPVLAPYRWLRAADPLPHSWDVTSDSIAAWVAGASDARHLVLVKPPAIDRRSPGLIDAYFFRTLPNHLTHAIVAADRLDVLGAALNGRRPCA